MKLTKKAADLPPPVSDISFDQVPTELMPEAGAELTAPAPTETSLPESAPEPALEVVEPIDKIQNIHERLLSALSE